jgi:hypothetical protein
MRPPQHFHQSPPGSGGSAPASVSDLSSSGTLSTHSDGRQRHGAGAGDATPRGCRVHFDVGGHHQNYSACSPVRVLVAQEPAVRLALALAPDDCAKRGRHCGRQPRPCSLTLPPSPLGFASCSHQLPSPQPAANLGTGTHNTMAELVMLVVHCCIARLHRRH